MRGLSTEKETVEENTSFAKFLLLVESQDAKRMEGYPNISASIGYSPETEKIYQISMIIVTVLAVPFHMFLIFMAVFMTPKKMTVYRLTVTNTSSWSLTITIYVGIFMQPVFLFPLTIAKVGGPVSRLGQFFGGQLQFYSLMEETLALYPELRPVISNSAIFGYVGTHVPTFLPPFIGIFLIVVNLGVSISLLYVFKETLTKVKRSTRSETNKFRCMVAFMLTSRTLIPVSTAFVPVMALMVIVYKQIGNLFALNCALFVVALSSGAVNCLTTILVFKPYRSVLIGILIKLRLWRRKEDNNRISTVVTENCFSLRSDVSRRNL
ncbi:serpentine type 7TM GPCR chemoreceptor srh domain-containing protein [Ditylenchus destructor]|uniref:Serpentine type 7TM GPCR chemoreceptor srh domain-containing protein n=1 Tax=Ditylenchus destructor TaxID=166010 RepID=A0AAD4MZ82_9BILA|nr:serpentine type 7TM GPCR chemoreceptor srh domain-containing protein [Ditylenchus destructor]